jgi:hypothetical protein
MNKVTITIARELSDPFDWVCRTVPDEEWTCMGEIKSDLKTHYTYIFKDYLVYKEFLLRFYVYNNPN